jgi:hypothetical protein
MGREPEEVSNSLGFVPVTIYLKRAQGSNLQAAITNLFVTVRSRKEAMMEWPSQVQEQPVSQKLVGCQHNEDTNT